VNRVIKKKK